MESKTKQYLLVTVVGVTLFAALLRLSDVLAFAAELVDLVLPILAGGILALFINVPMTGLEQLLHKVTDSIDTVLVNAVGAASATVNLVVTASFALIIFIPLTAVVIELVKEDACRRLHTKEPPQ